MIRNIVLCGIGGQGILLSAKIIAAAAEKAGFAVTTRELHGMAQRGGSVTAEVRFGDRVHSPLVLEGEADALGALEPIEALRYAQYLRPGALAAVSAVPVIPVTVSTGTAVYPADVEARLRRVFPRLKYFDPNAVARQIGDLRLSNTVILGAVSGALPEIRESIWSDAIRQCVKSSLVENNLKAFTAGKSI